MRISVARGHFINGWRPIVKVTIESVRESTAPLCSCCKGTSLYAFFVCTGLRLRGKHVLQISHTVPSQLRAVQYWRP